MSAIDAGWPGVIETVNELASTNAELLQRAAAGQASDEDAWLIADRQTGGRGRAGRSWVDGAGNFMGSTLVHLRPGDPPPQTLALVAGLAAAEAINSLAPVGPGLVLKWPNDLLLDQAKLGGILLERQDRVVVAGIGINLASAPLLPERPTTSLALRGIAVARDVFAHTLAAAWSRALRQWHGGGWPELRARWETWAHPPGTRLRVRDGGGVAIEGTYTGIGATGAAHLRLADGSSRVIHAGDVEMVG